MNTTPPISPCFEHSHLASYSLGLHLRNLRRLAHLTQTQLAYRAGLHRGTIADLERGRRANIWFSTACRLALALGLPSAQPLLESANTALESTAARSATLENTVESDTATAKRRGRG